MKITKFGTLTVTDGKDVVLDGFSFDCEGEDVTVREIALSVLATVTENLMADLEGGE